MSVWSRKLRGGAKKSPEDGLPGPPVIVSGERIPSIYKPLPINMGDLEGKNPTTRSCFGDENQRSTFVTHENPRYPWIRPWKPSRILVLSWCWYHLRITRKFGGSFFVDLTNQVFFFFFFKQYHQLKFDIIDTKNALNIGSRALNIQYTVLEKNRFRPEKVCFFGI